MKCNANMITMWRMW